MNLDFRQTRRLLVSGTVAFPRPYPSLGTIWFEAGGLTLVSGEDPKKVDFVMVQERLLGKRSVTRSALQSDVPALFISGVRRRDGNLRISRKKAATDLEKGEWFLGKEVSAEAVRRRLDLGDADITTRKSILKGIVFVAENRPVVSVSELITTARELQIQTPKESCACAGERMKLRRLSCCAPDMEI